jgi:uncharacterized lipoprotein YmbA
MNILTKRGIKVISARFSHSRAAAGFSFGLAALLLTAAGCASTRPLKYYQLAVVPPPSDPAGKPYPVTLPIGRIDAAPLLRDGGILYRTGAHDGQNIQMR